MKTPPLVLASRRLRENPPHGFPRRPGRRKKAGPDAGPAESGQHGGPLTTVAPIGPRLLTLDGAAEYLGGLSPWTIRDLVSAGSLPRRQAPAPERRRAAPRAR